MLDIVFLIVIGWLVLELVGLLILHRNRKHLIKSIEKNKENEDKYIYVNIEKHEHIFYLFEKYTGNFIAQGSNMKELKEHCESRFKGKIVVGDDDELKSFGLL